MDRLQQLLAKHGPVVGRFLISLVFLYAGIGKIISFSQTAAFMGSAGLPMPTLLLIIGLILELGGAVLLLVGYRARLGALMLVVFTALTIALFHATIKDPTQIVQGLKNSAIIGGLLLYVIHGAGAWSFDNRRKKVTVTSIPSSSSMGTPTI